MLCLKQASLCSPLAHCVGVELLLKTYFHEIRSGVSSIFSTSHFMLCSIPRNTRGVSAALFAKRRVNQSAVSSAAAAHMGRTYIYVVVVVVMATTQNYALFWLVQFYQRSRRRIGIECRKFNAWHFGAYTPKSERDYRVGESSVLYYLVGRALSFSVANFWKIVPGGTSASSDAQRCDGLGLSPRGTDFE